MFAGLPDHFFAVDDLPVDHRADLAVGSSQIEPDPAAVQMTAQRRARFPDRRHVRRLAGNHAQGLLIHLVAEEVIIEFSFPAGGIHFLQCVGNA